MPSPSLSPRADTLSTTNKRVRTSKPKVRSGCITCKARRIKCDEVKPSCDRCTKFGRECGGYKVQLTYEERVAARNGRSHILPKVHQIPQGHSHNHNTAILPTPPPSINVPLSPHQVFCIEASLELCRILEFPNWTSMKVEICKLNPFVGHAFSAIRMLSKGPSEYTPDSIDPLLETHDRSLLALHYDRFLEGSRAVLSNGSQHTLLASLICLLTICLETLQFHHDPALAHIQLGLTLITQLPPPSQPYLLPPDQIQADCTVFSDEITQAYRMLEAKASFLDSVFPFYAPMPLGFASPFVIPQLFCTAEEVVVPNYDAFGFGNEQAFDSRDSSVTIGTP